MIEYSFYKATEDIKRIKLTDSSKAALWERLENLQSGKGGNGGENKYQKRISPLWMRRNLLLFATALSVFVILFAGEVRNTKQPQIVAVRTQTEHRTNTPLSDFNTAKPLNSVITSSTTAPVIASSTEPVVLTSTSTDLESSTAIEITEK